MNRAAKITLTGSIVIIAGLAILAVPPVATTLTDMSTWAMFHPADTEDSSVPDPSAPGSSAPPISAIDRPASEAAESGSRCDVLGYIGWQEDRGQWTQVATSFPIDSGVRDGAAGAADVDSAGHIVGYTVAAGDAPSVIGDRFCLDGISILHFNGYWVTGDGKDLAPGDYLYLAPDPDVPNANLWALGTRGP